MSEELAEYKSKRDGYLIGDHQIIFINTDTKNKLDDIVRENLIQIKDYYSKLGYDFVYLPNELNLLNLKDASQRKYFSYFYPYLLNEAETLYSAIESNPYSFFADALELENDELPCLYDYRSAKSYGIDSLESIYHAYNKILESKGRGALFAKSKRKPSSDSTSSNTILFNISNDNVPHESAESYNSFDDQIDILDDEVMKIIEEIKNPNTIKYLIDILTSRLRRSVESKLSRLVIDEKFNFRLVDYGNMEIHLTPLQKVVYLFFLNHPEGIMFNSVYEYRDELLHTYLKISNRDDLEQLKASIDDLVDPLSNSLSEKCSKIRGAFLMKIDESLANHYFIDGYRGQPKSIELPREMIDLRVNINKQETL